MLGVGGVRGSRNQATVPATLPCACLEACSVRRGKCHKFEASLGCTGIPASKKRIADALKVELTEFAGGMNLQPEQQRKRERSFRGHW